jgi:hypothetical protein
MSPLHSPLDSFGRRFTRFLLAALFLLGTAGQLLASTFTDTFDRPNSKQIGGKWEARGPMQIDHKNLVVSVNYPAGQGGIEAISKAVTMSKDETAKFDLVVDILIPQSTEAPRQGLVFNWQDANNYFQFFYSHQKLYFAEISGTEAVVAKSYALKTNPKVDEWYRLKVSSSRPGSYELSFLPAGNHTTALDTEKVICPEPKVNGPYAGILAANRGEPIDLKFDNFSITTNP